MTVYVAKEGAEETTGIDETEFRDRIFRGEIEETDYYWHEGLSDWQPVSSYRAADRISPDTASKSGDLVASPPITSAAGDSTRVSQQLTVRDLAKPLAIVAAIVLIVILVFAVHRQNSSRGTPNVTVGASALVLSVTNHGTENWKTMVVYLNGQPPFTYKWEGAAPRAGESRTIPLAEFAKESGERFDAARTKVVQAWVGGDGFDYAGVRF